MPRSKRPSPVPDAGSPALEPEIESLPFVGKTWYRRGPSYWFRRALMSSFFLLLTALWVWFLWAVVQGVDAQTGRTSSTVLLVIVIVAGVLNRSFFFWALPPAPSRPPSRPRPCGVPARRAARGPPSRAR